MKALVIGGNGFIGSHLVDRLVQEDWSVTVFDLHERRYDSIPPTVQFVRGDLKQSYLVREALIGVDVVFHLAWATIHEIANLNPVADVHANLIPSIQLIEDSQRANVRKFVFLSSGGTVYGSPEKIPISENHPKNPVTAYGVTKLAVEKYLYLYQYLHGLDFIILRPSVPYGPRQNPLGRQGAVAVFLYRVAHGLPVTIWGDGKTSRDYFYITDLVQAIISCTRTEMEQHRILNIGGSKEISLNQLIKQVENIVEKKAFVDYLPARGFDASRIKLDTSLISETLDWSPNVEISQGLAKTWNWMKTTFE